MPTACPLVHEHRQTVHIELADPPGSRDDAGLIDVLGSDEHRLTLIPVRCTSVASVASVMQCEARGWPFDVRCDPPADVAARAMLQELLRDPAVPSRTAPVELEVRHDGGSPGRWTVRQRGQLMMSGEQLSEALDALMMIVNQNVVHFREDLISVHAAAVCWGDRAILMPAASGSGKSTLCARLLQLGGSYLTDESVGLTEAGVLIGYPKPLGFKAGTLDSFTPAELPGIELGPSSDWVRQVPPRELATSVARSALPALLAVPQFRVGAALHTADLTKTSAAMSLISQVQNLGATGTRRTLATIGEVVSRSRCCLVTFSDAREAASAVRDLLELAAPDHSVFRVPPDGDRSASSRDGLTTADGIGLCFDDGALLVRESDGQAVSVDATGSRLWALIADGTTDPDAITDALARDFRGDRNQIYGDVCNWIDSLVDLGLLHRPDAAPIDQRGAGGAP